MHTDLTGDVPGQWLVVDDDGVVMILAPEVHIVETVQCSS